jgi:ABC-type multidrug transport system ATPase subunit
VTDVEQTSVGQTLGERGESLTHTQRMPAGLVSGMLGSSRGAVRFAGRDVHAEFSQLRRRIGLVTQDDVVRPQLRVGQARCCAAVRLESVLDRSGGLASC